MARNLELKVGCTNDEIRNIRARAVSLVAAPLTELEQIDTYFVVAEGRLKLREIVWMATGRASAELIAYRRPDRQASRWSDYQRVELATESAMEIKAALGGACGVLVVVAKRRSVGIWQGTRIHLDDVNGLGNFVELETVAGAGDLDDHVKEEHDLAIRRLGLESQPVIAGSYSDLILERMGSSSGGGIEKEHMP